MLSQEQIKFLKNEGYLKISQLLNSDLIGQLRNVMDVLMYNPSYNEKRVENKVDGNVYVTNVDFLYTQQYLTFLYLLGSPFIQEIAETLCGKDFISVQEFAVIKQLGDNTPVYWHQDMYHNGGGNCFTMGIYLDDADKNDGALTIVPESHKSGKQICDLIHLPTIAVPVSAGDILIHDMLLAHCSGLLSNNTVRRVVYFEFVDSNYVLNQGLYEKDMIENRRSFIDLARKYYQLCKTNKPEEFEISINHIFNELLVLEKERKPARPSAYCFPSNDSFKPE